MANAAYVKIEGVDALNRLFEQLGDNADKSIKKAMRKASRATVRRIKDAIPQELTDEARELTIKANVKAARSKSSAGIICETGVFGELRGNGGEIPAWFKYYWKNSGTMDGRDPQHYFSNPTRKGSPKNPAGQKAQRFFERATDGEAERIADEVVSELKSLIDKYEHTKL